MKTPSFHRTLRLSALAASLLLSFAIGGALFSALGAETLAASPVPPLPPAAAPNTGEAKDQNLITNGNFEKGTDGWDVVAFGKKGKMAIDPMELYEGKPTLRIENAEGDHTFVKFTIQGKPHTSYRLSGMVKTKDVQSVKEGGKTGAVLMVAQTLTTTAPVQRTTPWKRVSVDFSTGDKAEIRAGPSLGTYASPVTGTAWFADISLVEMGDAAVSAPPKISAATPRPLTTSPSVAADIVKNNRSNLVFVTTPDGAGSGFIAKFGAATFLVTNAHVAAGAKGAMFKTLDGTQVQGGTAAVAVGHDVFTMALKPGGTPFEIMIGVDQSASIGDEVVVLGNAEGAGVINTIQGRIVGLGPNLVEVDAPFQPGNSGSPIIHLKSGKVIGVATYLTIRKYDSATKVAVKEPIVRRFGYRLDSIKTWQPVNWQGFYAQATEMESIEKLTEDLVAFLDDLGKDGRVTRGAHPNPVIKTRIDQWLEAKSKRLSPRDSATADQSLLSFLKIICQSDITAAQPRLTYNYFQRALSDQQRERTEISGYFSQAIENLR